MDDSVQSLAKAAFGPMGPSLSWPEAGRAGLARGADPLGTLTVEHADVKAESSKKGFGVPCGKSGLRLGAAAMPLTGKQQVGAPLVTIFGYLVFLKKVMR